MSDQPLYDEGQEGEEQVGEDLQALFEQAVECAGELMRENDALRRRIDDAAARTGRPALEPAGERQELAELEAAIPTLDGERRKLLDQLARAEERNRGFAERCVAAEASYHNLVSLYVATHQLHSTMSVPGVLSTVQEIVINLIGAEVFVIYLLDDKTRSLTPVAAEGATLDTFPPVELGSGIVGRAVESGKTTGYDPSPGGLASRPMVCVPLGAGRRAVGAIVIYRFLRQKDGITPLDQQLFDLLAAHAATAISTARLYTQSERKLSTMQGLMDLLGS